MAIFQIDQHSRVPIYEQLRQQVLRLAALGLLDEGELLPSVRQLAADLGINPNTVQKAYRELEREELIYTVPGKGSFLSKNESHIRSMKEEWHEKLSRLMVEALEAGFSIEEMQELWLGACEGVQKQVRDGKIRQEDAIQANSDSEVLLPAPDSVAAQDSSVAPTAAEKKVGTAGPKDLVSADASLPGQEPAGKEK